MILYIYQTNEIKMHLVHNLLTMYVIFKMIHILLMLQNAMHIHKNDQLILKKILI